MKLRSLLTLVTAAVLSAGCVDTIVDPNEKMEDRNIVLKVFSYFENELLSSDSLYTIGQAEVKFTDVRFLYSGYTFVSTSGDTVHADTTVTLHAFGTNKAYLAKMPAGAYNGSHFFTLGVDTNNAKIAPGQFPEDHPLRDGVLYRGAGKGYNHMYFTGVMRKTGDTLAPTKPFTLVVATPALNTQFERKMGFSIGGNRTCNINVVLNIDRLLQGIDPWQTPIIESDPTKPGDFAEAVKIKQNLVPAFVIQI